MSTDIKPSIEQESFINAIKHNHNIIGDCVAGSGKTTTCFFIAKNFPSKNILLLTYNSHLKNEVRHKALKMKIKNIEVHSYNSLVFKYYNNTGYDDSIMKKVLENNSPPKCEIPKFDIIIIDECQDMTYLYYGIIYKFIDDHSYEHNILFLGDKFQGIYEFKGADIRFLTLADRIWRVENFKNLELSVSYRLTNQISSFINEIMLGEKRIKTNRDDSPVKYIKCDNVFTVSKRIIEQILNLLRRDNVNPDDIFVLSYSIKSNSPVKKLENELVECGIPCYYPTSDETKLDDKTMRGKVVFSTFHQAKGRERDITIVYGFDAGHFKFFEKDKNKNVCPETLYIAVTRPKRKLIVIEDSRNGPLPFLRNIIDNSYDYIEYLDYSRNIIMQKNDKANITKHNTSPTEFVKFLDEDTINAVSPLVDKIFKTLRKPYYTVDIPAKINFSDDKFEDVSDINGIAIPAIYEAKQNGISTIQKCIFDEYSEICNNKEHDFLQNAFRKLKKYDKIDKIKYFLYASTLYISLKEKIYNKLEQIKNYDWLSTSLVNKCFSSIENEIQEDTKYEYEIKYNCKEYLEYGEIIFKGFIDAFNDKCVYELKCVELLKLDNLLQLIIYQWLWNKTEKETKGTREFKLINMRSGEVLILENNEEIINKIIKLILKNKYGKKNKITNEEFIKKYLNFSLKNINLIENENNCEEEDFEEEIVIPRKRLLRKC